MKLRTCDNCGIRSEEYAHTGVCPECGEADETTVATDGERLNKNGGMVWTLTGIYTSDKGIPRLLKVKHYENGWEVHVSIGAANKKQARATIGLDVSTAKQLQHVLAQAIERAEAAGGGN